MTGTEIEVVTTPTVRRAVAWWRRNPTLPASYLNKDGTVDVDGITLAADTLERLDVDPVANLGDTYVVHDNYGRMQLGFKADLQRALAERCGYEIFIDEIDDEHVVAHMVTPTGPKPPITKRLADKDLTAYAKRNPRNYDDKPNRMLEARVSTELIDLYAKGVLRGIITPALADRAGWHDTDHYDPGPGVDPLGEVPAAPGPLIDEADRAWLADRLDWLNLHRPDIHTWLRQVWKAAGRPGLRAPQLTAADGRLMRTLLQFPGPVSTAGDPPPGPDAPPAGAPAGPGDHHIPDHVHDTAPESRGYDDDLQPASYEDPGRPFT
jgi:hypothetical protein